MRRFALLRESWYACEMIGDEFDEDLCHYSTIKVVDIDQLNDGNRRFRLEFFHAAYPAGVQEKIYLLETIERGRRLLVTLSVDPGPTRLLQIYNINAKWLRRHFNIDCLPESDCKVDQWRDENVR